MSKVLSAASRRRSASKKNKNAATSPALSPLPAPAVQQDKPSASKKKQSGKSFPYRYYIPLVTFLGSSLLTLNGELKMGWLLGAILGYVLNFIFLAYIVLSKDALIANLFVFGLMTGFGTLVSDCYQVKRGVLIYPEDGPFWACSPEYMFWCSCPYMVEFACIAYYTLKGRKMPIWQASLLTAAAGALLIGSIEFQANEAQGWFYKGVPMLYHHLPIYIVLLQIPICGLVPLQVSWMTSYIDESKIRVKDLLKSAVLGTIQAAAFPFFSIIALEAVNLVHSFLA